MTTKITDDEIDQLELVIKQIEDFLKKNCIKQEVSLDTFVDPEYPEWTELKIVIKIDNLNSSIYQDIESNIYNILNKKVTDRLYEKLIIKIQSL